MTDTQQLALPSSIRERLELAKSLMDQNRPHDAEAILRDACVELARTNPELYTLIMTAQHGSQGLCDTTVETDTRMEQCDKTFLGLRIGKEWIPVTNTRTVTKTVRRF